MAALGIASQLPTRWIDPVTSAPSGVMQMATAPLRDPLHQLASSIRRPPDATIGVEYQAMEKNYGELLAYTQRLEQELREAREQIAQLSQVRESNSLEGVVLQSCQVTGPFGEARRELLSITPGSRKGIREGMVVADGFHLVGKVTESTPQSATVVLITAKGMRPVARLVPPTGETGPRGTLVQLAATGEQTFEVKVGVDQAVQVGDLAHLEDDMWPSEAQALVLGRVTAVERWPDDPELYRRVVVTPMRSLVHMTRVVVMVPAGE